MKGMLVALLLAMLCAQDVGEEEKKIKEKQAEVTAFLKTAKTEKDLRIALDELRLLADRAYAVDKFELSEKLLVQAESVARAMRSVPLITAIQAQLKKNREIRREFDSVVKAYTAMMEGKATPEEFLQAGKFLCFVQGNWDPGLKALSEGKDETLKALAIKDLAGAESADAQIALGDAWNALASKQPAARGRALHWYKKAWPTLKGVTRERIRNKFKEISLRPGKENKKLPETWIFWSREGAQLGEVKEIVMDEGTSPSGSRSVRISAWSGIVSGKGTPVKPGVEYVISLWVMTDSVPSLEQNHCNLRFVGPDNKSQEHTFDFALDQPWWQKMEKTVKAPDFATSANFNLKFGFKEGRVWLDDFAFFSMEERADLSENGGFEKMR